jgi:hypothetical protein
MTRTQDISARVAALDWRAIASQLDGRGHAVTPALFDPSECGALRGLYGEEARFRSRVVMERHAYGRGEYQYFARPLPDAVEALREALYASLRPIANGWMERMGRTETYPSSLDRFLKRCHAAGQTRPTPLLLKYGADDFNCLHQDLYGPLAFPLQATVLLSEPGREFQGGEFLLVEQRPRAQSKGEVVPLRQGEAVIFAGSHRPVAGKRGSYQVNLRHGVSRVASGERYTLGVIFHDAA